MTDEQQHEQPPAETEPEVAEAAEATEVEAEVELKGLVGCQDQERIGDLELVGQRARNACRRQQQPQPDVRNSLVHAGNAHTLVDADGGSRTHTPCGTGS